MIGVVLALLLRSASESSLQANPYVSNGASARALPVAAVGEALPTCRKRLIMARVDRVVSLAMELVPPEEFRFRRIGLHGGPDAIVQVVRGLEDVCVLALSMAMLQTAWSPAPY